MNTNTENTETAVAGQNCEQIKIDPKYKLELVASKLGGTRPTIEVIRIDHSKRFGNVAVSTQGKAMAIVPIAHVDPMDEEIKRPVTPYNVSQEALKASRKVKRLEGELKLNGNIELGNGQAFPLPDCLMGINYPRWEVVLPDKAPTFEVALDAQLLLDLAKALGTDGKVTLSFIDELSPIAVTPNYNGNGEYGVLMPMRIGG